MTSTETTATDKRYVGRILDKGTGNARKRYLVLTEIDAYGAWLGEAARVQLTEGSRGRGTWREISGRLAQKGLTAKGWKQYPGAGELRSVLFNV